MHPLEQVNIKGPRMHVAPSLIPFAQPQPPSVREILGAYRMKGEGDREMLLAILQAKTAEDQVRLAIISHHPLSYSKFSFSV